MSDMRYVFERVLTGLLLCASCATASAALEFRIPAPNGVGDVVALTNAFTELTITNTSNVKILLEPGVYDLSGIRVGTRNWHLTREKQMQNGLIAGTGKSPGETVIKGGGANDRYGIFYIWNTHATKATVISNLTLTGGYSRGNGGAVFGSYASYGCNLVLSHCIISNNYAVGSNGGGGGGAIHVKARHCLFADNVCADWHGGGLAFYDMPSGGAWDCTFSNNTCLAAKNGGGVYVYEKGASVNYGGAISNCTFIGNSTAGNGGGVYASTSAENVQYRTMCVDCRFYGNSAAQGGGVGALAQTIVTNCIFKGNTASGIGGGAWLTGSTASCNCAFETNEAPKGAGVYLNGSSWCAYGAFTNNVAPYGGGAYVSGNASLDHCVFKGNGKSDATSGMTPNYGGGAYLASGSVVGCEFIENFCDNGGGAYLDSTSASIRDSLFKGNRQTGWASGAAVLVNAGTPLALVSNCVFTANIATNFSARTIISNAELVDCVVSNHNIYGAILQNCNLTRCYVSDNVSTVGSGVDLDDVLTEKIGAHTRTNVNCVFVGNHLTQTTVVSGDKVVLNCTYLNNRMDSGNYGMPISDCKAWNSLFTDNIVNGSPLDMRRFDHQNNVVQRYLTNCLFKTVAKDFDPDANGYHGNKIAPRFKFNPSGSGGEYDIKDYSPAFNAGVLEDWMLPLLGGKDFASRERVKFGAIDIGALECPYMPGISIIYR